jgi:hypothetical protein
MDRHRLRRILDAAGCAEPSMSAQRMIGAAVGAASAADPLRIPIEHLVEQAHAAAMWDSRFDPGAR